MWHLCRRSFVFVVPARRVQHTQIAERGGKRNHIPESRSGQRHPSSDDAQDHESRRQNGEAIDNINLIWLVLVLLATLKTEKPAKCRDPLFPDICTNALCVTFLIWRFPKSARYLVSCSIWRCTILIGS